MAATSSGAGVRRSSFGEGGRVWPGGEADTPNLDINYGGRETGNVARLASFIHGGSGPPVLN